MMNRLTGEFPDRYPGVLVVEEKHVTRYFAALTPKGLEAAALSLLRERWEAGYWYEEPGDPPEEPNFRVEDVPAALAEAAAEQWARYRQELREYRSIRIGYERIKQAVETENGRLAYIALTDRADGEYEGVHYEPLEGPTDLDRLQFTVSRGVDLPHGYLDTVDSAIMDEWMTEVRGPRPELPVGTTFRIPHREGQTYTTTSEPYPDGCFWRVAVDGLDRVYDAKAVLRYADAAKE